MVEGVVMKRHTLLALAIVAVVVLSNTDSAFAVGDCDTGSIQQGDFKAAMLCVTGKISQGYFGAMATAITAALAIIAAITGSFRGAWAVMFVSVGLYVLDPLVKLFFGN